MFTQHAVAFVVVGGVAAQQWGATRPTKDFDAVVDFGGVNLARVAEALNAAGARLRVDGLSDDEARRLAVPIHSDALARIQISTWQTDLGAVDVLSHIPDLDGARLDYETLAERATEIDVDGVIVQVADLADIIASKRWADRPKDRDALLELDELQHQRDLATDPGLDID